VYQVRSGRYEYELTEKAWISNESRLWCVTGKGGGLGSANSMNREVFVSKTGRRFQHGEVVTCAGAWPRAER
jgi:hypothetical protein